MERESGRDYFREAHASRSKGRYKYISAGEVERAKARAGDITDFREAGASRSEARYKYISASEVERESGSDYFREAHRAASKAP